jgi:hypothetical protein
MSASHLKRLRNRAERSEQRRLDDHFAGSADPIEIERRRHRPNKDGYLG